MTMAKGMQAPIASWSGKAAWHANHLSAALALACLRERSWERVAVA